MSMSPSNSKIMKDRSINGIINNDEINIQENLEWIESETCTIDYETLMRGIKTGPMIKSIENECNFCDRDVLKVVMNSKQDVFDKFTVIDLSKARTRANPFETIRSAIFMNRAALKMANIDAATNFMFSDIDRDPRHKNNGDPYYFADVCAGPGGFTEYMLWKKKWGFKGFGFTLKGVHDFKVHDSTCCSSVNFQAYYGSDDDGDIFKPDNIRDFTKNIMLETNNEGVHFMMADGGFSVEGNEHLQEIISKQIYVCQCLVGLEIVRKHGHFVTKLFDTFTLFTVGMIYLMFRCFDKIAILKPNSSRPANSERYLICSGLKDAPIVEEIRKYFRFVVFDMHKHHRINNENDILEIVPLDVIKRSPIFFEYITRRNNAIAKKQVKSLSKLAEYCENSNKIYPGQEELRAECLKYWMIPNIPRPSTKYLTADMLLNLVCDPAVIYINATIVSTNDDLAQYISDPLDWHYVPLQCNVKEHNKKWYNFFAGIDYSIAYKHYNYKWSKVENLYLARGTLLYGELVTEHNNSEINSLHIIDALRLGETSLADLPYQERMELIKLYCKSVNFETSSENIIKIRPKPIDKLVNINGNKLIQCSKGNRYFSTSPKMGYNSSQKFDVNSVLFLKIDKTQNFNRSYALRVQLSIDDKTNDDGKVSYKTLMKYVGSK